MLRYLLPVLAAVAAAQGCAPAATDASANAAPAPTVAMAKCAGCGKEKPAGELVAHDGQQLCADCIASHGH